MTIYSSIKSETDVAEKKLASVLTVVVLIAVVILPYVLVGIIVAFPAVALPRMGLDVDVASWFVSIGILFSPVGGWIIGFVIERYGKKTARLLGIVPSVLGWFVLSNFSAVPLLLIAQLLLGFTSGAVGYPTKIYAGEFIIIHSVKLNNYFAKSTSLITAFGIFVTFVLGYYVAYQTLAKVAGFMALLTCLMIYVFIPERLAAEKPLLKTNTSAGKSTSAEKKSTSAGKGGTSAEKNTSADKGGTSAEKSTSAATSAENVSGWAPIKRGSQKLKRKDVYRPFYTLNITFLLTTLSGAMATTTYMIGILNYNDSLAGVAPTSVNASQGGIASLDDSYKYGVVAGGLILLANVIVCCTLPFVGVKRLHAIAHVGACVGMLLLGYTTLNRGGPTSSTYSLHVLAVCLVNFMFNFGPLNIVREILKDAFPADAKDFANGPNVILSVSGALMNKLFPYLFTGYGGYLYYGYAGLCAANAIFCYVYLPDVVGTTLDQISEPFRTHE